MADGDGDEVNATTASSAIAAAVIAPLEAAVLVELLDPVWLTEVVNGAGSSGDGGGGGGGDGGGVNRVHVRVRMRVRMGMLLSLYRLRHR